MSADEQVSNREISASTIDYLINHVYLPPKLAQHDDSDLEHERTLIELVYHSLLSFKQAIGSKHHDVLDITIATIAYAKSMHESFDGSGAETEHMLDSALEDLCTKGKPHIQ